MRATLAVVAERGYAAATVHGIVRRAGSSKPTVYRRWRSKPHLVAAAVRHALAAANPTVPATGDALRDVTTVVRNVIRTLVRTPLARVVGAVLGVVDAEPELAAALLRVEGERRRVLRGAVARVRAAVDADLDVDLLLGAIYFRTLIRRRRVTPAFAAALTRRLYRAH